jgi:hypothetical protein
MIEPNGTEFCDVEQMVRAAGGVLAVSDDLRPRILEEAREERRETSTRSRIVVLAVLVAFVGACVGEVRGRLASTSALKTVVTGNHDELFAAAQRKAVESRVDPSWSLADAFRELRQSQSRLIEDAF